MVTETHHIIEVTDIKAVQLQCSECGGEVVCDPNRTKVPKECPLCYCDWVPGGMNGEFGAAYAFANALRRLLKQNDSSVHLRIETGCE